MESNQLPGVLDGTDDEDVKCNLLVLRRFVEIKLTKVEEKQEIRHVELLKIKQALLTYVKLI